MPINYHIPSYLQPAPADIMGATITGLQLGEQAGAAAARAAEADQRAKEATMEFQQRAAEGAQKMQMQQQQLAVENMETAAKAREAAFKFQQQQLHTRALQELGPDASIEEIARVNARFPYGATYGAGYGANIRAIQPSIMPTEMPGVLPGTTFYNPRTGTVHTTPQARPEPKPKATPEEVQLLVEVRSRIASARREVATAARLGGDDLTAARRELREALKEQDDLFKEHPVLRGLPATANTAEDEQVGQTVTAPTANNDPLGLFK